jgi:benzoyl-CoA-dihydrodiol lyase
VFKSVGDPQRVLEHDMFLKQQNNNWLAREIRLKWRRVLKRVDMTSRSLVTLIEPGSCFASTLAELIFAADRAYMLIGQVQGDNRPPATIILGDANCSGELMMSNGWARLRTRFLGEPQSMHAATAAIGQPLDAEKAEELGLITAALDDIDWDDEVRLLLEERASFSPDGLTGMEANLRFAGPETMETKIFARLTAWQNWIFQRPNAVGPEGALTRYGSGQKPNFDLKRV